MAAVSLKKAKKETWWTESSSTKRKDWAIHRIPVRAATRLQATRLTRRAMYPDSMITFDSPKKTVQDGALKGCLASSFHDRSIVAIMNLFFPGKPRFLVLAWMVAAGLSCSLPCRAVESGIAAEVNTRVITRTDVAQRIRFLQLFLGDRSPEGLEDMVLNTLVEENLKLDMGERARITATDEEVEKGLASFAAMAQPGASREAFLDFLKQNRVSPETVRQQVQAQIIWQKGIQATWHQQALISEREIDQEITRLARDADAVRYEMAEIVLPFERDTGEAQAMAQARRLLERLGRGERFELLAQQFSRSPTARDGGNRGHVPASALDSRLRHALDALTPGQCSEPVRTTDAIVILLLKNRQKGLVRPLLSFRQGVWAVTPDSEASALAFQLELKEKLDSARSCPAFDQAFRSLGESGIHLDGMSDVAADALSPHIRAVLAQARPRQPVEPFWTESGLVSLMVCEQKTVKEKQPSREDVAQSLYLERINRFALKTMRDLRRRSTIVIRGEAAGRGKPER